MITIVSDSSINLTKKEAEAMGVQIVPMTYTVAGRTYAEHFIPEDASLDKLIMSEDAATSQPVLSGFAAKFRELFSLGHKQILCLVISSRLSGAYSSAVLAAKEVMDEAAAQSPAPAKNRDSEAVQIRVVDTRSVAGGIRFLAEQARALVKEGKPLEQIAKTLERERDKSGHVISVEKMDRLRKSGRLGFVRQAIGSLLNIRPILLLQDGALISHTNAKGSRQQIEKMVEAIPAAAQKIIVHYLGDFKAAEALAAAVSQKFPRIAPPAITRVGPVIGIHLGPTCISAVWTL